MFDPNNTNPLKEAVDALGMFLLGATGGLANLFVSRQRPNFYTLLSCFFVSGFAGVMAGFFVSASPLESVMQNFVVGMAGFGGPVTLSILYGKMAHTYFGATDKEIENAERKCKKSPKKEDDKNDA